MYGIIFANKKRQFSRIQKIAATVCLCEHHKSAYTKCICSKTLLLHCHDLQNNIRAGLLTHILQTMFNYLCTCALPSRFPNDRLSPSGTCTLGYIQRLFTVRGARPFPFSPFAPKRRRRHSVWVFNLYTYYSK